MMVVSLMWSISLELCEIDTWKMNKFETKTKKRQSLILNMQQTVEPSSILENSDFIELKAHFTFLLLLIS